MRRVPAAFLMVLLAVGALTLAPKPVSAGHWCVPSTLDYSPPFGYLGDSVVFRYELRNNVAEALTVLNFTVTYSWDATAHDLGGATIPAQGSQVFGTTEGLPSTPRGYTISFMVYGRTGSDAYASLCYYGPFDFTVLPYARLSATSTATPSSGDVPLTVSFSASASGGEPPYTFFWLFGDGDTSSMRNASHTYQVAGTYNVSLTATDSNAKAVVESLTVSVKASWLLGSGRGVPPWAIYLVVAAAAVAVLGTLWRRRLRIRREPQQPPETRGTPPAPPPA